MTASKTRAVGSHLERARELVGSIRAAREEIDALGRLPDGVVAAIRDAGLFRMAVPASIGGGEVDALEFALVAEEIGRADGSAAWCVVQGAISGTLAAYMEPGAAAEVFGAPDVVFAAGTPTPAMGRAQRVPGGYRVSGSYGFASGCRHATGVVARCHVYDEDGRQEPDGGAPWINFLVPIEEATLSATWDVRGLRGTSSDTYTVEDAFVPERFAVRFSQRPHEEGRLYRVGDLQLAHLAFASAGLGMAADALDELVALAGGKRVGWTSKSLAESAATQVEVARAAAKLDAARALRDQTAAAMWEAAASPGRATPLERARFRLAMLHAVDTSVEVVDTCYRLSGTSGIFAGSAIQRHFQDVNVLSQQILGRWSYYETVGRALLGLEFDTGWL
jgi:alkylation response protein AidB-like acyl-CoA dehydrogenase